MAEAHPLYPEREVVAVTVRGNTMPGLFTGEAAIWTGGSSPRIIGPFPGAAEAYKYMTGHPATAGGQIFPFDNPEA
jgi:hypothetical protein